MIFEKVQEVIAEQTGIDKSQITMESTFDELNIDSLDMVELVMALEEEYNVEIDEDAADKIKTIGDVVDYISKISK